MRPIRSVVIVGAGQAGGRAARALRLEGFAGRVALIGEEPHAPYRRPPLSKQLLAGEMAADQVGFHEAGWYDDHDIELRTGSRATALHPADGTVELATGARLAADVVLLATGGRPRHLPGQADSQRVLELRTLEDALRLREELHPGRHLVVVGGGFIGLEIAATARSLGCRVTVLEALGAPLAAAVDPRLGRWCARLHRAEGVQVRTGVRVRRARSDRNGVRVELADGGALAADLVVVGIGIVPNTELALQAGCEVDDGVVVDAYGRTSVEGIWAAGDLARHHVPRLGRAVRVEHFDNADRHATAVARNILGHDEAYDPVHWFWSDQYDCNLQYAGQPDVGGQLVYRGDPDSRSFTAWLFDAGELRAAFGVNRGREILIARRLLRRGASPTPEQLADQDTDLVELARGG